MCKTAPGPRSPSVATVLLGVTGVSLVQFAEHPLRLSWQTSPFMATVFVVLAVSGIAIHVAANRPFEVETDNRLTASL